mmetsp:Transcript_1361/g.1834  ORF Transcript_1361/g.1834 Transcript_1361/m.1834 type:complete len:286 (-) Transcript_1361:356-1213(-)|eukprot:CAMPEP_0117743558 /NCGR_PEP_ID=MMETSP0947-20121206/6215_1 /TAXON_ID=44440 /ORGANISM="Chattonella subsalsa, Strain CCMP2191" /LENGTH=285 /DNA_ID=CAMNT_0005560299 /DNA_START=55 /DNA_END=912 /DNA_ORIENTATION=+
MILPLFWSFWCDNSNKIPCCLFQLVLLSQILQVAFSSRYDRAITIFSPDGKLEQVEYAAKAVQIGSPVVALSNDLDTIVICCEKTTGHKLQNPAKFQKILKIDEHIHMAFAGLRADGRVLSQMLKVECQQYRFSNGQAPPLEYVASRVADIQYGNTRRPGARPFGVSCLLAGFGENGHPRVFRIDPSGNYAEWRGVALGRGADALEGALLAVEADFSQAGPEKLTTLALRTVLNSMDTSSENSCCEIVVLHQKDGIAKISHMEAVRKAEDLGEAILWSEEYVCEL